VFDLTGKRALVTGASGGIGREIAKALGKAGAQVALSGTRMAALEETSQQMGGEHPILPCNLGNQDEVDKLVPAAESALGGLDILVNNAGMTRDNLFMRMKNEEWD
jgi:3-oxoacyl-[acyl-carrier protein] reductase